MDVTVPCGLAIARRVREQASASSLGRIIPACHRVGD
jgi:hypothetical protein